MSQTTSQNPAFIDKAMGLFDSAKHIDDLPADAPERAAGSTLSALYTESVARLKEHPSLRIAKLAELVWDIVGNNVVRCGIGPDVPTMSFLAVRKKDLMHAMVVFPMKWLDMIKADPVMQAGAVVYNGSKIVDFYNGFLISAPATIEPRAMVYEAEYLLSFKAYKPDHHFNRYQREVMAEYPEGLDTPKAAPLLYESKPFFQAQA